MMSKHAVYVVIGEVTCRLFKKKIGVIFAIVVTMVKFKIILKKSELGF